MFPVELQICGLKGPQPQLICLTIPQFKKQLGSYAALHLSALENIQDTMNTSESSLQSDYTYIDFDGMNVFALDFQDQFTSK